MLPLPASWRLHLECLAVHLMSSSLLRKDDALQMGHVDSVL